MGKESDIHLAQRYAVGWLLSEIDDPAPFFNDPSYLIPVTTEYIVENPYHRYEQDYFRYEIPKAKTAILEKGVYPAGTRRGERLK